MHELFEFRHVDAFRHRNHKWAALARKNQLLFVGSERRSAFIRYRIHAAIEMLRLRPLSVDTLAHVNVAARVGKAATGQRVGTMAKRRSTFSGSNKKEQGLIGAYIGIGIIELRIDLRSQFFRLQIDAIDQSRAVNPWMARLIAVRGEIDR